MTSPARWLVLSLVLGCSSSAMEQGDPRLECDDPPPPGRCECVNDGWWACTTCGFGEGRDPVACSAPGDSCQIATWEHGCTCSCNADGWWHCDPETVGSMCPGPPVIDACAPIEAEWIGVHPSWVLSEDPDQSGSRALATTEANAAFTFDFTGTTIAMRYERGPTRGTLSVSVDGGTSVVVDANESAYEFADADIATGLANAQHTVTVICTAPSCLVDVFAVTCN
jgi:hypothetical protein